VAWIESHQSLLNHPKLLALCQALGAEKALMVGHLHILWWWCMDYAMDGDLSRYSNQQIADACGWRRDHDLFVNSLATAGFVDQEGDKKRIHDWFEFCGEIVRKRLDRKETRRKTAENGSHCLPKSAELPPTNQPTNQPTNHKHRFMKPTPEEVTAYANSIHFELDGQVFCDFYESKGWLIGKAPMKNWKAAVSTWKRSGRQHSSGAANGGGEGPAWMRQ
jgi:hypothetical protein